MSYEELLECVRARLASHQAISMDYVRSRYRVLQMMARKVIQDLQDEGLIGREWDVELRGYPVLKQEGNLVFSKEE
jgi:hypothetical protein